MSVAGSGAAAPRVGPGSPAPRPVEPAAVEVFVRGRTLRGTLGDAFVREAVELFAELHGAGPPPRTSISRAVELTAVAVTRAGRVRVDCTIADPVFAGGRLPALAPADHAAPGERIALAEPGDPAAPERPSAPGEAAADGAGVTSVRYESLPGAVPLAAPAGVDRSRTITVHSDAPIVHFHVVLPRTE
ncbi:hypothetical protein VD659_17250 [Herbiconiux sp. 11R-BC]|uniref:hypothetical protein n=1 Tax=Herbiconiux sp. 11R-BC TaxID=3111637 RepID=UPI003C052236